MPHVAAIMLSNRTVVVGLCGNNNGIKEDDFRSTHREAVNSTTLVGAGELLIVSLTVQLIVGMSAQDALPYKFKCNQTMAQSAGVFVVITEPFLCLSIENNQNL